MNKQYEKPVVELIVFQTQESILDGGWDDGFDTSSGWGEMPVNLE